jgi:Fe-S oxidoreductase
VSHDHQHDRTNCSYCPKLCRHACPAAEAERSELATPTFKQQVALLAATGERPLDAERAHVLWKCTDCAGTVPACRHRIDVAVSLREARVRAVEQGVAPAEVAKVRERFAAHGSPYTADLPARLQPGERVTSGPLGVLPACAGLAHEPDEPGLAVRALRAAGVQVGVALPDPPCCGYPLDTMGLEDEFRAHARRVAASLEGFEALAVAGPACAWTMATRYAEVGVKLRPRVAPLVDHLAARLPMAGTPALAGKRVAYHDPCFLARRLRRTAEPRAVIRALTGSAPLELDPAREDGLCSGAAGGYPLTHPGPARSCAAKVLDAAAATKADVLVTGCPSARRHLAKAAPPGLEVRGLVGLLRDAPK